MNLKLIQVILSYLSFLGSIQSFIPEIGIIVESNSAHLPISLELTTPADLQNIKSCPTEFSTYTAYVRCENVEDIEVIRPNVNISMVPQVAYLISESSIRNITPGVFKNISKPLDGLLLQDSTLQYFDLFSGFNGLENSLKILVLANVSISNWVYSSGARFQQMWNIAFYMPSGSKWTIDPIIPQLPGNLNEIYFENFVIRSLENLNFRRFEHIKSFSLASNGLNSVNRRFLPRPARFLKDYDLSYNPITSLPEDMFDEMPILENINLSGTGLSTLHFNIFLPVLDTLKTLQINEIPLRCDCDTAWLLRYMKIWKHSTEEFAVCYQPTSLMNYDLSLLEPVIMCYNCKEIQQSPKLYYPSTTSNYTMADLVESGP